MAMIEIGETKKKRRKKNGEPMIFGSAIYTILYKIHAQETLYGHSTQRLFIVLNLSSLLYNLITLIAMTVRDRTCYGIGFHKAHSARLLIAIKLNAHITQIYREND